MEERFTEYQDLRFIKEKATRSINFKNMMDLRNSCSKILIGLLISSTVFASLYFTKHVDADNGVSVDGTIEAYDSDGVSPLTNYDFPLFTGGTAETCLKDFFVNNTGNQPVAVYWNVTASSIFWEVRATPYPDVYDCYEDNIWKYSFGIRQDFATSADYWYPDGEGVFLGVGEGTKLRFELHYTGEPNTAETFTMAISFYARHPSTISAVVNVEPDTLNLKSQGKWVACYIELPEGYDVNDINFSSIKLNDTIAIDYSAPIIVGEHDNDGITDLNVKFSRSRIIKWLEDADYFEDTVNDYEVTFEVTGEITEAIFEGYDIIKITCMSE